MGALIDIQLRFEYLKKEVENTDLFSKARDLALYLYSMESCLNDIIEEYENSYIKMSCNGEYPLNDLKCLKDFITRPKNSKHFAPMFFEPADRVLDTMLKLLTSDAREIEYTENKDALVKNLQENKDSAIRWRAAKVLGHYRNPNATDTLIEALTDKSGYVRLRAAEALGKIKDVKAKESLMKLIQDETEYYVVQEEAKKSLKKIEDAEIRRKCLCRVPEEKGSRCGADNDLMP